MSTHNRDIHTHTQPGLDIPIFTKLYEFYKLLSEFSTLFPKTKRYTLGQRLDSLSLEIFELLFSLSYSDSKSLTLQKISTKLDLLKILLRLAKDTRCINNRNYLGLQAMLQEIGKMLGGWIKAAKQNA